MGGSGNKAEKSWGSMLSREAGVGWLSMVLTDQLGTALTWPRLAQDTTYFSNFFLGFKGYTPSPPFFFFSFGLKIQVRLILLCPMACSDCGHFFCFSYPPQFPHTPPLSGRVCMWSMCIETDGVAQLEGTGPACRRPWV